MNNINTIFDEKLALFIPHIDDGVIACGGTILKIKKKEGIYFVYVSDGRKSPYSSFVKKNQFFFKNNSLLRKEEGKNALQIIGIPENNIDFLDLEEGNLKKYLYDIKISIMKIIDDLKVKTILIPFRYDRHPDHLTVYRAVYESLSGKIE